MTQEDKELLLKDLCARLPYHPVLRWTCDGKEFDEELKHLSELQIFWITRANNVEVKPYLRPMSSMTDEERKEYTSYCFEQPFLQKDKTPNLGSVPMCIDWLDKNMFDYRGLIPMGLAIEVTEENNPYK